MNELKKIILDNLKEKIKINPNYEVVDCALGWFSKGVLTAEDVENIKTLMQQSALYVPQTVDEAKLIKIAKSKELLATYLEEHPLESTAHGATALYTVTEDKQNMLSRKFSAHLMFTQAGIADTMTWNAQGQPCEEWTDAQVIQLLNEMSNYITPLVSKQQHYEVAINNMTTIERVDAINIDYSTPWSENEVPIDILSSEDSIYEAETNTIE